MKANPSNPKGWLGSLTKGQLYLLPIFPVLSMRYLSYVCAGGHT